MPDRRGDADFGLKWIRERTGAAERRQVVVLAIGFEPAAAADPEDIAETLSRRRALVARIAARYGGSVERADPALQLVCWGWPVSHDADARLAVAAAIDIAGDDAALARCGLDVGIAIAPGDEPSAGNSGLVCEALHTAVGYQLVATPGQVIVSDAVAALLDGFFEMEAAVRDGRRGWIVERPSREVRRARHPVDLVGRTAEVARLEDCWRDVLQGGAHAVSIEGASGMGKSALAARLARLVAGTGGRSVLVACLPERQQNAGGIREQLTGLLLHRLRVSSAEADCLRATMPLAQLLCLLAGRAAAQAPLAIFIADANWIDAESAAAIALLVQIDQLLLVETRRSERTDPAAHSRKAAAGWIVIELAPLAIPDIVTLVRQSEAGARLSSKNLDLVCEDAEGNPRYALELARLCAERPDHEAHRRLLSGPNRLNAHLTSRLDALTELKPLAQAAAVLGRLFDARVLAVVLEMEQRVLTERLQLLVQTGILSDRRDRRAERYRFKHALIWSQAYGSVLKSRRRELHLKMAVELTQRVEADRNVHPESVAHHWKKAGRPAEAFVWWVRAARAAAARGADAVSIDCINEALATKSSPQVVCTPLQEAELHSLLARQQQTLRGRASPEAIRAYEAAMALLEAAGGNSSDIDLDIAWGLASIHLVRGDVKVALGASAKLIGEAIERGRPDVQLLALRIHGTANLLSGRVAEAVDLLNSAVQMFDAGADNGHAGLCGCDPAASALAHLSSAQAIAGDRSAALATRRRALQRAEQAGDAYTTCNVLGVLALGAIHLGEAGPAAALARGSEEIASRHGYSYWTARAGLIQAWGAARRSPGRGMEATQKALDVYRGTGAGRASVIAHCLAAEVALDTRLPQEALELLTPFRNKGHLQGEWIYIPELLRLEAAARVLLVPGRRDDAHRLLAEAAAMASEQGNAAALERILAAQSLLSQTKRRRASRAPRKLVAAE